MSLLVTVEAMGQLPWATATERAKGPSTSAEYTYDPKAARPGVFEASDEDSHHFPKRRFLLIMLANQPADKTKR